MASCPGVLKQVTESKRDHSAEDDMRQTIRFGKVAYGCAVSFLFVVLLPYIHFVLPGADERRRREGACNYRIHASAIQIQIISESTSKDGNQPFNQAS